MSLTEEIRDNAKKVHTTAMKMSISEIISMYREKEIVIQPEFQKLFRWEKEQKSSFIESILIGIPIPSIFVQQMEDGRWEIIDGLQRIFTILEFVGILLDEHKNSYPRLELVGTKFLPSLKNITYESFEDNQNQKNSKKFFDFETKLIFKRTPLYIQVIKRDSDKSTKYELFDRLNSSGSPLANQEIRNAIFLIEKPEAIKFIKRLAKNENFMNIIQLSEKQKNEAYDEELIVKFFAYIEIPRKISSYNLSVKEFLDGYIRDDLNINDIGKLENNFNTFFNFLNKNFDFKVFRRINRKGFLGSFKISKFEALIIGLFPYLDKLENNTNLIKEKIDKIENEQWFIESSKQGSKVKNRIDNFLKNAPQYFNVR